MRLLLCTLAPFHTHLVRLNAQDFCHTDTQLFTLDDGCHKARQFRDAKAVRHVLQGFTTNLAQLNLPNHAGKGKRKLSLPFFGYF